MPATSPPVRSTMEGGEPHPSRGPWLFYHRRGGGKGINGDNEQASSLG